MLEEEKWQKKIISLLFIACMLFCLSACRITQLFHTHDYSDATCTEPKTCTICEKIEGEALGHERGAWSEWDIDYDEAVSVREVSCTRCETVLDTESEDVTSFVDGNHLSIYPSAFADRFDDAFDGINGYSFESEEEHDENKLFYDEDNILFYRIKDDSRSVGMYSFSKGTDISVPVSQGYSEGVAIGITFLIEETTDVSPIVAATVLALDPGLGYSEAFDFGQSILDNVGKPEGVTMNSINYILYKSGLYHYLQVTVV